MTLNWKQLNVKAKILVIGAIAAAGSMHIDKVKNFVTPLVAAHPRWSSAATSFIFIIGVIQNPITQKILHQLGLEEEESQPDGSVLKTSTTVVQTEVQPPTQ